MQIIDKRLSDLTPYDNNPRNNEDAVDAVANSIREFGFKVPIVIDRDGVIVAGHTRYAAAQKLDYTSVPCVVADDLTPEQARAFRLADNQTASLSGWNFAKLEEELAALESDFDMADFGFDLSGAGEEQLDGLFQNSDTEHGKKEKKEIKCPHCGMYFTP